MRTQVPINVPAWWLIIMPVLSMLLIGVIVLIVINIVNTRQKKIMEIKEESNNSKSKDENSKDKTLTNWIKKKDLLYWLLIVCLGTISLFTFRYKNATEVISHWSFAGTIVSIILAVVAIGFTLFQTLTSELSSEKIAKSAEKIVSASDEIDSSELKKSSEIIRKAASEIIEYHTNFESKLSSINNDIMDLKNDQKENFDKVIAGFYSSMESTSLNDERKNEEIILSFETFAMKIYPKFSNYYKVISYYLFYEEFHDLKNDVENEFIKEFGLYLSKDINDESLGKGTVMGSVFGLKQMLTRAGTIKDFIESTDKAESLLKLDELITHKELRNSMLKVLGNIEE